MSVDIRKIQELFDSGMKQAEIARVLNISKHQVHYYLNRKKIIRKKVEAFQNKTKEQRRKVYKQRAKYVKDYLRKKYQEDEKYREKKKKWARSYYKKRFKNESSIIR